MFKKLGYIVKNALLALVIKFPAVIVGDAIVARLGLNHEPYTSDQQIVDPTLSDFFGAVIFAPIIETVVGQMLPIWLITRFTKNKVITILFSALVFSLLHYPVLAFLPAAFVVGVIFARIYLDNRTTSRSHAFWMTALVHLVHNLIAFLMSLAAVLGGFTS